MFLTLKRVGVFSLISGVLLTATSSTFAQTIQGAGATFPYPIYKEWFAKFQETTKINVNYQSVGSGAGIKALQTKTVDFGASDAPLSTEEERAMPAPVIHVPTVGGAIALCYNIPGVGSGLRLTPEIVTNIFLGKIKKWNDPALVAANPKRTLPDLAVQPVHRTDGSGTTFVFTHYLKKVSSEWASGPGAGKSINWPSGIGGKGNAGVAGVIQRTSGTIGYLELAYAAENKITFASIKNKGGVFIAPSVASTTAAIAQFAKDLNTDIKTPIVDAPGRNSYPIAGLTYILIYKTGGANAGATTKLWAWALDKAQQEQAKVLYYAPLPGNLIGVNKKALKSVAGAQVP
jgi:phosphate transport system substrate-binding protein